MVGEKTTIRGERLAATPLSKKENRGIVKPDGVINDMVKEEIL